MTAQGRLLTDTSPLVAVETPGTGQGVRLTLDADLQRACEGLATLYLPRGCLVVMDTATGEVLASVSMPSFDPQNVAASIAANDTSLLNRPLRAFSAGSVFKVVLAAAAYESALTGTPTTARVRSRLPGRPTAVHWAAPTAWSTCAARWNKAATPIHRAGPPAGGTAHPQMAETLGFGTATQLAPGLQGASGTLPDAAALETRASWRRSALARGR